MVRCDNCFKEYDENYGVCPYCGYLEGDPPIEGFCLMPGTILADRYVIGEMVGLGGFGITYKAWDTKLCTVMAVKEFYPSGMVNRDPGNSEVMLVALKREREFVYGKTRFLEEARNMAKFNTHPDIVNVFDFFEANNTAYIVMEFLEGKTLSKVLHEKNAPLPYDYCVDIASHLCSALKAIHKEKILHRDISPDNIMICSNGAVKLFDFGAARFSSQVESRVTVVVKPGFAPPEQYDKVNRQDPRTDIYALGATMYYALTGLKPEESTNRKIEDTMEEPSKKNTDIPQYISTAIMRAMAVEQQYRFETVDEFEEALQNKRKVEPVQQIKSHRRKRRITGIAASIIFVAAAAAAVLFDINERKSAVTLPDATLQVWYIKLGDETKDAAKEAAFKSVIKEFTNEYKNVSITLRAVPSDGYINKLLKAEKQNKMPDIFESTGMKEKDLPHSAVFSEALKKKGKDLYYFDGPQSNVQYPTSIVLPAIYINTTLESADIADRLFESDEIKYSVKESSADMFTTVSGKDISGHVIKNAKENFLVKAEAVYLGDTSDYFDIQKELAGEYTIAFPNFKRSVYRWGNLWSISDHTNKKTRRAAVRFLEYFNSDLAQDYFYIQNQGRYLPCNRNIMKEIFDIYEELGGAGKYLDKPYMD